MNTRGIEIFYIPTLYIFKVRLKGDIWKLLSWWFLLIVPTLGYTVLVNDSFDSTGLFRFLILTLAVVALYELGYMNNDTIAISREVSPTIRLNDVERDYYLCHLASITATRLSLIVALLIIYVIIAPWGWRFIVTICFLLSLSPLFDLYNHTLGPVRVLFYPILISTRYIVFLCPFIGSSNFGILLMLLLLSYPAEISIERFSMPKNRYGVMRKIINNEESKTTFRALYYFLILIFLAPIWSEHPSYCLPILIIGIYRWIRLFVQVLRNQD